MILALLFAAGLSAAEPPPRQLLAVELVRETPEVVVRLIGDGPLRYSTLHLDEPPRVVFDLEGVIVHSPWPRLMIESDPVRRVRVAQLQVLPEPVTRVVFDLEHWSLPIIVPTDDGLLVTFEPVPSRPSRPTPSPPPRAPTEDTVVLPDPALPPISPPEVSAPPPAILPPAPAAPAEDDAPADVATPAKDAPPADAPRLPRPGGRLITTLQLDDLAPESDGGGGVAITWLRPLSGKTTLLAGVSHFELDDARWTFGQLGVLARPGSRLTFRGELHGGGGERTDGAGFEYRIGQVELIWALRPKRLYLRVEDRYIDVDTTAGNLLGAGLTALPRPWLSTTISYLRSTGGRSLEAEYVTGRIDGTHGRLRFFGGFAAGRSQPTAVGVVGVPGTRAPGAIDLEQIYSGLTAMLRGAELTVVLDRLDFEIAERTTLSLSLSIPLDRKPSP